jgi:hypothetical protein
LTHVAQFGAAGFVEGIRDRVLEGQRAPVPDRGVPDGVAEIPVGGLEEDALETGLDLVLRVAVVLVAASSCASRAGNAWKDTSLGER